MAERIANFLSLRMTALRRHETFDFRAGIRVASKHSIEECC